jgi:hypothetical protein
MGRWRVDSCLERVMKVEVFYCDVLVVWVIAIQLVE